jgi:phospholipid/cholesterol/gamma-HCH transport system substrate-binding protein
MSQKRYEIKVGIFMFIGLVLLAVLVVLLTKGTTFKGATIQLNLNSGDVGGIKAGANVLLSGVSVGRVSDVNLSEDGRSVAIVLSVYKKHRIYQDAQFSIEKLGFLGDQYISIQPTENKGRVLASGDTVECTKPFNMQEAIARATATISSIGQAATNANQAISDVRRFVLTEETLKRFGGSLDQFSLVTGQALDTISNVNTLVTSNALPVTLAVSNLNFLAAQLAPMAEHVNLLVSNNESTVTEAIQNIRLASVSLTNLLHDLETRKGLAGRLLSDEQMSRNFSELASNLASVASTLDKRGLWGLMWAKKPQKPGSATSTNH